MLLTKFTHSCVRLQKDSQVLVIDPGVYSEAAEALDGASAVLVTHEHPDHIDVPVVVQALQDNPALEVYAPSGVAAELSDKAGSAGERVHAVDAGSSFTAGGFAVQSFGGQHAIIHPLIPVVANIGYLVERNVFHPGDSFVVPDGIGVKTLLVPLHAPWSKVGEVVDFVVSVRAPQAYPVHDALLNELGRGLVEGHVGRIGGKYGTTYTALVPGQSVEV